MKEFIDMLPTASPSIIAGFVLIGLLGIIAVGGFIWLTACDIISSLFTLEGLVAIVVVIVIIALYSLLQFSAI